MLCTLKKSPLRIKHPLRLTSAGLGAPNSMISINTTISIHITIVTITAIIAIITIISIFRMITISIVMSSIILTILSLHSCRLKTGMP